MIDSASMAFTSANAIAELHVRDRNQKESNGRGYENKVSHVRILRGCSASARAITMFDWKIKFLAWLVELDYAKAPT
jgi:hypothetical protein